MTGFIIGNSFSINKKPGPKKAAGPPVQKNAFGDDDSDDDSATSFTLPAKGPPKKLKAPTEEPTNIETITELDDDFLNSTPIVKEPTRPKKSKKASAPGAPSSLKNRKPTTTSVLGDLSSALESKKYIEATIEEDANIYDYDAVYDALKPVPKAAAPTVEEARPKYMSGIVAAAAVRKRDQMAAEQVRLEREREAEGDEFADKEVFVTEGYRKAQEEAKKMDEELKKVEEEEAKKRQNGTGMTDFYKKLLDDKEAEHKKLMEAVARRSKMTQEERDKEDAERKLEEAKSAEERAKEIIAQGGKIAINEDGEVVDKRQLLHGGLNILPSRKNMDREAYKKRERAPELRKQGESNRGSDDWKAARERQTKMFAEQLAASKKREREEEEAEKKKIENMAKTRKTEADVLSARERYLARKKAAEEVKRQKA